MDRRSFLKLGATAFAVAGVSGILSACGQNESGGSGGSESSGATPGSENIRDIVVDDKTYATWDDLVEAARGGTFTYMAYQGFEKFNNWVENVWAVTLKEKYGIDLVYVDSDAGISTLILNDLANGVDNKGGTFDVGWINASGFIDPQKQGGYFGPLTPVLPNFQLYGDEDNINTYYDYNFPTDGYEVPYGYSQIVFIKNNDLMPETPTTPEEFLECAKKYPGKLTYIAADSPSGTGIGILATFIYNIVGDPEKCRTIEPDEAKVRELVEPAMKYLRDLNPYLWKEGKTFPNDDAVLQKMFIDGQSYVFQVYDQYTTGTNINEGIFEDSAQSFLFDGGTMSNFNYMGIPYNAPNKEVAMVAINEMLSPEMQIKLHEAATSTVLDTDKLSEEDRDAYNSVDLGPNNVTDEELFSHSLPEWDAEIDAIVTKIWLEEVVGKTN